MTTRSRSRPLLLVSAALVASLALGVTAGAAGIPPRGIALALLDLLPFVTVDSGLAPVEQGLLFELRVPRVLLVAMVGGLLAIAGAGYQGVFRNPLADPYLLGAAAGAGLTVILAGVAVSSFLTALQAFVQQLKVDELQRIYAWILGGVGGGWDQLRMIAPYAVLSSAVLLLHGRLLDVLSVGDEEATSLGLH